jgi:hypothetical protein
METFFDSYPRLKSWVEKHNFNVTADKFGMTHV